MASCRAPYNQFTGDEEPEEEEPELPSQVFLYHVLEIMGGNLLSHSIPS